MENLHSDCACTVCGCVCDDLVVEVREGAVATVTNQCQLAEPFFASVNDSPDAPFRVHGQAVDFDAAVREAAKILCRAQAPLIFGLSRSSTDGQRAAVQLADRLGGTIDTTASVCHGPSIMAIQQVGESTSSLGEVRQRADLVIFWGADPAVSHPRHFERYSLDPASEWLPRGRKDRFVVVVDSQQTATSDIADLFIEVPAQDHFDVIWTMRAILRDLPVPEQLSGHVNMATVRQLVEHMKACKYGAVFFGLGLAQTGVGHANVEALLSLVEELNAHTRFTARRLRIPGDVTGADLVLCWQTGFPFAVNLTRGYPRYNPGEYSAADLLSRHEVDACLLVGSDVVDKLPPSAQTALSHIPTIFVDYPNAPLLQEPQVQLTTAIYGIHAPGMAYRMDEIPIPLRALIPSSLPTDHQVLAAIERAIITCRDDDPND